MFNAKLNRLKHRCIEGLRTVSIEDTRGLVSLASDILALLYYSIRRNSLREDHIIEDMKEQTERKYQELN
ncbi:hypothetical protein LCGC14_0618910 [marine sediment metagenome]|uniref:Uncharacterized protein n=1 Tax=marine sediment metagenome TaxID=412755 RepID=A0A0F9TRS8_9ZZZZ